MGPNQQTSEWKSLMACDPEELQNPSSRCRRARYLESILNSAGITAVIATDPDFVIRYYNPAARALFDLNPSDTEAKRISEISSLGLTDVGRFQEMVETIGEYGEYYHSLERVVRGESRQIESVLTGIYDHDRQLTGFLLNAQDVTSRKAQEERITRKVAEEQCLGALLHLSLERTGVETFLQHSLESLLESIPWLNLLPQGAIFLVDQQNQNGSLRLVAKYRLSETVESCCQRILLGYCICGRCSAERCALCCRQFRSPARCQLPRYGTARTLLGSLAVG